MTFAVMLDLRNLIVFLFLRGAPRPDGFLQQMKAAPKQAPKGISFILRTWIARNASGSGRSGWIMLMYVEVVSV